MAENNPISRDALDLFGSIVSAQAAAAASASNDLTALWAEQAKSMAEVYIRLFQAVDKAAAVVTTRELEKVLAAGYQALDMAHTIRDEADRTLATFDPEENDQ